MYISQDDGGTEEYLEVMFINWCKFAPFKFVFQWCFKICIQPFDEMLVKMQGEQSNNQVECFDVSKAATKYIDEEIQ
ncbi:hypothetical protein E3N88_41676 [Mikania micrantha]|uniref:Uncharacterized protein n=1 Tax=Mikania micrantha TaxID=192012 RepID=A0A5N6LJY7_9ASTR|nr:hypothetical protein E3N88_41676 [Mikania micrantha]